MRFRYIIIVFMAVLIYVNIPSSDEGSIQVFFCAVDNCSMQLTNFIRSAQNVDCAFFDLKLEEVADAIIQKNGRLILDRTSLNITALFDNRSAYMHNKFCVAGNRVFTGSFNPTYNGAYKNANNMLIIESKDAAAAYQEEFNEMYAGIFGGGKKCYTKAKINGSFVEIFFCPEDNCGARIKEKLLDARQSIHFMTFSFTHESIINAVLSQNVTIKGIFDARAKATRELFEYQGHDVISAKGVMHHKVFIIDESIVIAGSFNPSKNADTRNDENVIVIHDKEISLKYLKEFKRIREEALVQKV